MNSFHILTRRGKILKNNGGKVVGELVAIGNQHDKRDHKKLIGNSTLNIVLSIANNKSVS